MSIQSDFFASFPCAQGSCQWNIGIQSQMGASGLKELAGYRGGAQPDNGPQNGRCVQQVPEAGQDPMFWDVSVKFA